MDVFSRKNIPLLFRDEWTVGESMGGCDYGRVMSVLCRRSLRREKGSVRSVQTLAKDLALGHYPVFEVAATIGPEIGGWGVGDYPG